ncbi:unnamed protein product [Linum trigynum]|uniref:Uncharacterized protein n=1 Tax=Linum trigynum TaxID=586398 RepID=A0AAV2CKF6_9ROSI
MLGSGGLLELFYINGDIVGILTREFMALWRSLVGNSSQIGITYKLPWRHFMDSYDSFMGKVEVHYII